MASFKNCIADALKAGEIDKDIAEAAHEAFDAAIEGAAALGPVEAERTAARATLEALDREALRLARTRAQMVRSRTQVLEMGVKFLEARGYTDVSMTGGSAGGRPPKGGWTLTGTPPPTGPYASGGIMADFMKELIDGSGGLAGSAGPSVKGRYQAVAGSLQAMMADLTEQFDSSTGLPWKGRALLDNLVAEAFGEETGDAAASALAKAWTETADYARKLFNSAGGDIARLENWGLPTTHNAIEVRKAGRDGWIEAVAPRLDRAKMIDRVTQLPFTDRRLRAMLGDVYQTIVSRGGIDAQMGEGFGPGRMADRHQEHRVLVFASAKDWRDYNRQFSAVDPYATMHHHLDRMAREIAQMQVLGPNPTHQFEWLAKAAQRMADVEQGAGAKPQSLVKSAGGDIDSARKMLGLFTGELAGPYGQDNVIARVGSAGRAALSGIQLGTAVLNDLTSNPVFAAQVKTFAGLSALPDFRAWASHVASPAARSRARRTGFIAESTRARHADAVRRFVQAQTVGAKAAEGINAIAKLTPTWVHRASFLDGNMRASRAAAQDELMGHLFDHRRMSLAQMAAAPDGEARALGALLRARGFTEAEWRTLGQIAPETPEAGVEFLSPMAINRAGHEELGWKVAELIEREVRNIVPEPSLWAQAQLIGDNRPGTIKGELIRGATSYRSFTVTQTYTWLREFELRGFQAAGQKGLPWQLRAAMLAAPMILTATVSGALNLWLRDMVKGRDPRAAWSDDPDDHGLTAARFWGAAAGAGAGFGLLTDFLFSVTARNGRSAPAALFGPVADAGADVWDLTAGNALEAWNGKDAHVAREGVNFLRHYTPLSSLWWARTAFDRAVVDQLQRLVDPDADDDFRRQERRMARDYGQESFWPEGEMLPTRAPDLSQALGAAPS